LILEGREEGRVLLRKGENEEDGLVFAFLLFFLSEKGFFSFSFVSLSLKKG
jgi:hypothetical protein